MPEKEQASQISWEVTSGALFKAGTKESQLERKRPKGKKGISLTHLERREGLTGGVEGGRDLRIRGFGGPPTTSTLRLMIKSGTRLKWGPLKGILGKKER